MHNPLQAAFLHIEKSIPEEILKIAFKKESPTGLPIPVYEVIRQDVISRFVLQECNLYGGVIKSIPLKQEYVERVLRSELRVFSLHNETEIYRIPPEERENSEIGEILDISPPINGTVMNGYGTMGMANAGTSLMAAANRTLESQNARSFRGKPLVELLSGDLVRLSPASFVMYDWILTVRLMYDERFTNMNSGAIKPFCDLVLAAVKSYIYNKLIVKLDQYAIEGGALMPSIRAIIEEYKYAKEEYDKLILQFGGGVKLGNAAMMRLLHHIV